MACCLFMNVCARRDGTRPNRPSNVVGAICSVLGGCVHRSEECSPICRPLLLEGALVGCGLLAQLPLQLLHGAAALRLEVRHVRRKFPPRQALFLGRLLHRRLHAIVVMARLLARLQLGHLVLVLG